MTPSFHIAGLACPCGCPDLVMGAPGTEADTHDLLGLLAAPVVARAWCSRACALAGGGYTAVPAETPDVPGRRPA